MSKYLYRWTKTKVTIMAETLYRNQKICVSMFFNTPMFTKKIVLVYNIVNFRCCILAFIVGNIFLDVLLP